LVRLADMYRLPLADASFDLAVIQMVLHYAEDPPGVLAEAARVLRPGGRLIVIDLAEHGRDDLRAKLAHRWPGFGDDTMNELMAGAGMQPGATVTIDGPLAIRIWSATAVAQAPAPQPRELVV
jgi:ArsR family transcriptional regulator